MKKRFGISRCCCGDGGGAGQCLDSCLANWGGNSATAVGNLINRFDDWPAAISEDSWFTTLQGTNSPQARGSDGNFEFFALQSIRKGFAFDSRTQTTIETQTTAIVPDAGFTSSPRFLRYGDLEVRGSFTTRTGQFFPVRVSDSDGNTINLDSNVVTIRSVQTYGQVIDSQIVSGVNYIDNNGILQNETDVCFNRGELQIQNYVNGSLFSTVNRIYQSYGVRCYELVTMQGLGFNSTTGNSTQTSNTTLSVS